LYLRGSATEREEEQQERGSPQENREITRKHRGKNVHSTSISHLYHRLRRLQREHRQEEKDRPTPVLPAFVIVSRISDNRSCAEAAAPSPRPFQCQVSFHAFSSLCILIIYLLCMPFMFTVQVNYNSLEQ